MGRINFKFVLQSSSANMILQFLLLFGVKGPMKWGYFIFIFIEIFTS